MTGDARDRGELALRIGQVPASLISIVLGSCCTRAARDGFRDLLDLRPEGGPVSDAIRLALDEGDRGADPAEAFELIHRALLGRTLGWDEPASLHERLSALPRNLDEETDDTNSQ